MTLIEKDIDANLTTAQVKDLKEEYDNAYKLYSEAKNIDLYKDVAEELIIKYIQRQLTPLRINQQ